ncbi:2-oxo acid dehydrogenase subunit E2 [Actinomadura sp. GTD37]|uniref:2-oxo acid dehydrogenase subunit E2 n=1 Tax=Actinomadura sp. GTD37 TaxID=1778030 RepID=UPI0035C1ADE6
MTGRETPIAPVARERRHTLHFLDHARTMAPVFLDTEVDMTAVREHRDQVRAGGGRLSWVTYLLHAAGRVLAAHPEANAAITGRVRPRVARPGFVDAKVTLDRTLAGQRIVLPALIRDVEAATLEEIQAQLDHYRDGDPAVMPEYARIRMSHRMPWPVRRTAVGLTMRSLRKRIDMMGTLAVTSLGHSAVDSFHSVGGTTITLGVGRVAERPVARAGELRIAPVMRLSLAFDHRVIDGAEAADVLTDLKNGLEFGGWASPVPGEPAGEAASDE